MILKRGKAASGHRPNRAWVAWILNCQSSSKLKNWSLRNIPFHLIYFLTYTFLIYFVLMSFLLPRSISNKFTILDIVTNRYTYNIWSQEGIWKLNHNLNKTDHCWKKLISWRNSRQHRYRSKSKYRFFPPGASLFNMLQRLAVS